MDDPGEAIRGLLHAAAVRERAHEMLDIALEGGVEIGERVPIPDGLVPDDANVEMEAKKAAGYFTPDAAPTAEELKKTVGRDLKEF